jgi:hypothetical protein
MEEGVDFYFNDQGLMVLTAVYLKKRGYCCKNKCTNCPWNYGKENNGNTPNLTINDQIDLHDSPSDGT